MDKGDFKVLQKQLVSIIASSLADSALKLLANSNPNIGKEYITEKDKGQIAAALSHVFYAYEQAQIRMKQSR